MSRKFFALLAVGSIAAVVVAVALVRAQESSRRTAGGLPTPAAPRGGNFAPAPAAAPDSDVAIPIGSAVRNEGSLADRLKSIRSNVTSEYATGGTAAGSASPPTASPAVSGSASPAPSVNAPTVITPAPISESSRSSSFGGRSVLVTPATDEPRPLSSPTLAPSASIGSESTAADPGIRSAALPKVEQETTHSWSTGGSSARRTASLPQDQRTVTAPVSSSSDVSLSSRGPTLRVDTKGPRAVSLGKPAAYTITVQNTGDVAASEVMVAIDVPMTVELAGANATSGEAVQPNDAEEMARVIWSVGSIAARSQTKLTLQLVPRDAQPFELAVGWAFRPDTQTARIEVQQPELEMTLGGPKEVLFGETQVYTITLFNPGTGDAENVRVTLSQELGGQSAIVGTIGAGQRKQFEVELTAKQAGQLEVRAVAVADGDLRAEAAERVLVRHAELAVTVEAPQFKYAGSVADYRIRVVNQGDAIATDVISGAVLPRGAKYLGGLSGAQVIDGGLRWTIGKLGAGDERVFEFQLELSTDGENRLEVGVRGAGNLSAMSQAVTTVEALADLKLVVEDPQGPKPVGQDVVYQIRVLNRGTKAARQVNVIGQFSKGIEPTSAVGATASVTPGQVVFDPIEKLDAGAEVTLKITARAESAGNHVFRAEVKCIDPESRQVFEGTTRYFGDSVAPTAATPRRLGQQPAPAQNIETRR